MFNKLPHELERNIFKGYLGVDEDNLNDYEIMYWKNKFSKNFYIIDRGRLITYIKSRFRGIYNSTYKHTVIGHGIGFASYGFEINKRGVIVSGTGRHTGLVNFGFFYGHRGSIVSKKLNKYELEHFCNSIQRKKLWVLSKILV